MDRPRVALGLEASRATLNRDVCLELGRVLAKARATRGLGIGDVAARLLLSPRQVTALEGADSDVFYGADFYAAALKKYAVLLEVRSDLIDRVRIQPQAAAPAAPAAKTPTARTKIAVAAAIPRPRRRVLLGAGVIVTGLAASLLMWAVRSAPPAAPPRHADVLVSAPPPAAPTAPPPAPLAAAPQVPSAPSVERAPALVPASAALASRDAARRTWIFVRYADNSTVQRGLGPDEEFVLQQAPIYLAIGAADNADVVIAGRTIDTAQFTTNGQLRVGSAYLTSLATP